MTDTPAQPLTPVARRAHGELHAAVTALLGGDTVTSMSVITTSPAPFALAAAAVRELTSAVETIAAQAGGDPEVVWREVCALWTTDIDT